MAIYKKFTLDDNKVQVESAIRDGSGKNIENNYAKQDGNYQTMTVGASESLTPYSENSGVHLESAFIMQTAGGGSDIGSTSYLKSLRGNSIRWAQLMTKDWARAYPLPNNSGLTASTDASGFLKFNGTANLKCAMYSPYKFGVVGHKFLIKGCPKGGSYETYYVYTGYGETENGHYDVGEGYILSTTRGQSYYFYIVINAGVVCNDLTFKPQLWDLTEMFGAGNEPTLEEFNKMFPEPYYEYDAGQIINSQSSGIRNVGCNAYDNENPTAFIRVIPEEIYTISGTHTGVELYNIDKTLLSNTFFDGEPLPIDCNYIKVIGGDETTMFRLSWGEDHDFVPYEKHEYALPNIELRGIGGVYDELKPDGTLIRRIGVVDLGTLTWSKANGNFRCDNIASAVKKPSNNGLAANILCVKYKNVATYDIQLQENSISINTAGRMQIYVNATYYDNTDAATFKQSLSGVLLYYELDTPVETQDDSYKFQELQYLDDFGTQEFLSEQPIQIPQGSYFFYPVDYKAFIDSLGGREDINYSVDSIVSHEEADAEFAKKDGYYEMMGVGRSDTLTSKREIDDPELACQPITFGIAGGDAEIQTGYNMFEFLEGKSIRLNQLSDIPTSSTKSGTGVDVSYDGETKFATFNGTTDNHYNFNIIPTGFRISVTNGHKYLFIADVLGQTTANIPVVFSFREGVSIPAGNYTTLTRFTNIVERTNGTSPTAELVGYVAPNNTFTNLQIRAQVFDLTAMGLENIVSIEEFKELFPLDYYTYDTGSILSAKSASLISRGKNQFQGLNTFTRVVGGETYEISGITAGGVLTEYDINKNLIHTSATFTSTVDIELQEETAYVKIAATTYADIMFYNTFKEDGGVYNEPYEEPQEQVIELPNIELRSVPDYTNGGEIKDIIYSSAGGLRKVGIIDLGSLTWSYNSTYNKQKMESDSTLASLAKKPSSNDVVANIACAKFVTASYTRTSNHGVENSIALTTSGKVVVYSSSMGTDPDAFKEAMSGVYLLYELGTPTELSENTGWAENIFVDNYGTLEFTTDPVQVIQVPQPYFIRYTISLTEFLDSVYVHASGDANDLLNHEQGDERYAQKDGNYDAMKVGNLIPDMNREFANDFVFGTGEVDTVDGEAELLSVHGHTEWSGTTPSYANVVSNKSVIFNLYNPETGYAHVVKSDDKNNGLCVFGTDITAETVLEFSETSDFTSTTDIALTEATNSTGDTFLHCSVSADGFLRLKNTIAPDDFCISNVWGGYRVNQHPAYEETNININSATDFSGGMKSIEYEGKDVVYDELTRNRKYVRVGVHDFGANPSISYGGTNGVYNWYYLTLSEYPESNGYCIIGGSSKFEVSFKAPFGSSKVFTADSMALYRNSGIKRIEFAIAQSEDTSYTYSQDELVVDAESFATQKALHTLYTSSDGTATGTMTEATEYVADTPYFYVSATNTHGLNGQAIIDEIKNKVFLFQKNSMDKSIYIGTGVSARSWTYICGDFGTEELTLANGFPAVPTWVVSYPINVKEEVQRLPENYISVESCEDILHQVGKIEGFDFDSLSYNGTTGKVQINGLTDTTEVILISDCRAFPIIYGNTTTTAYIPTGEVYTAMKKVLEGIRGRYGNSANAKKNALTYFLKSPVIYIVDNDRGGIVAFRPMAICTYGTYTLYYQSVYGHPDDIGSGNWIITQILTYHESTNEFHCIHSK